MKYLLAITAAAVLALAAGGRAQAGGRSVQHHQPHDMDHGRYERPDRHDQRDHCERCHDYSWCSYPCYDYPPCGPDCDYKPYKGDRGRTPDGAPVRFKVK